MMRRWFLTALALALLIGPRAAALPPLSFPASLPVPRPLPELPTPPTLPDPPPEPDEGILQAGCSTCGGRGLLGAGHGAIHGKGLPCVPGREPCHDCDHHGVVGRFLCGLYDCLCCPDPCYDPQWIPIADSAFFVDCARPVTQTRIRWDSGLGVLLPDRAEYFWARADGQGKGPRPPAGALTVARLKYNDLSLYTEAAAGKIGVFTETPYRSMDPEGAPHAAGFGDISLGTKTLLFDCELLQVAFQFRTTLPVGNAFKGLGNGHVALEPSLIFGVRVGPDTFFQAQIAEWIPLGGDPNYSGAILHYHFSLNHLLCRILPDVPLIGTFEFNGWSFQDGAYTDPTLGAFQRAGSETYVSLALGLRLFVCDRIDFGFAAASAVTDQHWAQQLYRTEFRFRF